MDSATVYSPQYISSRPRRAAFVLLGLFTISSWCSQATAESAIESLRAQRDIFVAAEQALQRGAMTRYGELRKQIPDYPLFPYLEYAQLRRQLSRVSADDINEFTERYADTPLADRLHTQWLIELGRRGQWQRLATNYRPSADRELRCYNARALLQTGDTEQGFRQAEQLWHTGHSLPKACDPVLAAWRDAGNLTTELNWDRIHLALQANQTRLARYLGRDLPAAERQILDIWLRTRREPERALRQFRVPANHRAAGWILADGLIRLGRRDPDLAARYWENLPLESALGEVELVRLREQVAAGMVASGEITPEGWLEEVNETAVLDRFYGQQALDAFARADWEGALAALNQLSDAVRSTPRWLYWRARALEAMDYIDEAMLIYAPLATSRSYYGFLSADRSGFPYHFEHHPVRVAANDLQRVGKRAGVMRARELFFLGRSVDARREWHHETAQMTEAELLAASRLAYNWGWHDRTISTLSSARYWDDLEMRFPVPYVQQVSAHTTRHAVSPAWAYAIIRQESAFTPDARSRAGALGLMQLMPQTARQVARSLKLRLRSLKELLNSDTNIELGVTYLGWMSERFDGHPVLATAAYNAGAHRVQQWLPETAPMSADLWIERVPYRETRKYLKRVLTYTVIYHQRLGQGASRIADSMPDIPVRPSLASGPSAPSAHTKRHPPNV